MAIEVVNRQRLASVDRGRIARVVEATLAALGLEDVGVTVALVRDPVIRRLNRDYRGKDRATDVLSFPAGDGDQSAPGMGRHLGDIAISTDTAIKQAGQSHLTLEREIDELVLHGMLHLCGYDHETDAGQMNRLERKLRRQLLDFGRDK